MRLPRPEDQPRNDNTGLLTVFHTNARSADINKSILTFLVPGKAISESEGV